MTRLRQVFYRAFLLFCIFMALNPAIAQKNATVTDSTPHTVTVIAGSEYRKGGIGRFFWGNHYRTEWTTPVVISRATLDSLYGGLTPVERGGGRQTKNLRLDATNKRQYAIRSVNKDYGKALPEVAQGTFVESIIKDQMSVAHPYAAPTVAVLSKAANVYTTDAKIFFIGDDADLGKFRSVFANDLYSLEDRPGDKNAKFYDAKKILDTEDLLKEVLKDNDHRVDAVAFASARLFDMFIGDWDRHDDQWKWAEYERNGQHIYVAFPKDRDQAYSKFDGLLVQLAAAAAGLPYLQGFHDDIRNVEGFNLEARPLDAQFLASLNASDWQQIASSMQGALTDAVIEKAIRQLPPEIFAISGNEIIGKLKSRRDHLPDMASRYYRSLAKNIELTATKKDELLEIIATDNHHVQVNLYDLDKNDRPKARPYFTNTFSDADTKEIRIYGIGGNDRFVAKGTSRSGILVRLIGGDDKDVYTIPSTFNNRVRIYDNPDNDFSAAHAKRFVDTDTSINRFNRKLFKPDKTGLGIRLGYSNEDRIYAGLGYKIKKQQWRKQPYGYMQDLSVLYSFTQKAFRFLYKGTFNEVAGKWNLGLLADYDLVRDAYFMGVGNNTRKYDNFTKKYYLYRDKEFNAAASLYRTFDSVHTVTFTGFYQHVQLLGDPSTYLYDSYLPYPNGPIRGAGFAGARVEYDYTRINDPITPNKGLKFHTGAEYTFDFDDHVQYGRFSGLGGFYLPLGPLTLATKVGAATLTGDAPFYQLNKLGGGSSLRGYTRYRFYGRSAVYNQNELQWNFNVKTYLFSGKMGLIALFDNGRVWWPGENSDKWHTAFGGGLMLAPFNKISVTGTYAISPEDQRFSVRIGHFLKR